MTTFIVVDNNPGDVTSLLTSLRSELSRSVSVATEVRVQIVLLYGFISREIRANAVLPGRWSSCLPESIVNVHDRYGVMKRRKLDIKKPDDLVSYVRDLCRSAEDAVVILWDDGLWDKQEVHKFPHEFVDADGFSQSLAASVLDGLEYNDQVYVVVLSSARPMNRSPGGGFPMQLKFTKLANKNCITMETRSDAANAAVTWLDDRDARRRVDHASGVVAPTFEAYFSVLKAITDDSGLTALERTDSGAQAALRLDSLERVGAGGYFIYGCSRAHLDWLLHDQTSGNRFPWRVRRLDPYGTPVLRVGRFGTSSVADIFKVLLAELVLAIAMGVFTREGGAEAFDASQGLRSSSSSALRGRRERIQRIFADTFGGKHLVAATNGGWTLDGATILVDAF